jgi:DeoR family transcriptional regulator, suf operon transcriptional repressor
MQTVPKLLLQDTRRKILDLLKKKGPQTVQALSRTLGITSMGVRQQLNALERDGLIQYRVEARGLGRPGYVYMLTGLGDELFPRTYPQFAGSVLETVKLLDGEEGIERIFAKRTDLVQEQYEKRLAGKDLERQVQELARIRTEEGYMAEWEKVNQDTFLLRENNCAICEVARQCIQACSYELALFQRVLPGANVTRESHILQGDGACTYRIRRKRGAPARTTKAPRR